MNSSREGYTLLWKIENFSCAWHKVGEKITSPIFILDAIEKTKWKLLLYPKGESTGNYISFYLKRLESRKKVKSIIINYELSFLTEDGEILKPSIASKDTFENGEAKGRSQFKTRDELFHSKCLPQDILTAYCRIWISDTRSVNIFVNTIISVEKVSFVWNIENFSKMEIPQRNSYEIKSVDGDDMVTLELFLTGNCGEELINTCIKSDNRKVRYFRFNSFLLDTIGNRIDCGRLESQVDELLNNGKLVLLVSKKILTEKKNIYLPNDVLSLNCECDFSPRIIFEGIERIERGISSSKFRKEGMLKNILGDPSVPLIDALRSMYSDGLFFDTELRTSTKTFSAHKNILSARSPVFKEMFRKVMKDKTMGCVEITDIDAATIHRMLLYLYTDTLEGLKWETASELYVASDKYQISCLKSKCSAFLIANLTISNVCEALILADIHQDEDLKNAVIDYILQNDKPVFCSSEWKHLMDTRIKLAAETMYLKYNKD